MRLLFLCDAPAARRLACDSAADCKPHAGVGIGDQVLTLNQFKQVLRRRGEIGRRLWTLFDPQSGLGEPLRNCLHLPGIEKHLAQIEALLQVEQCSFDGGLEIERFVRIRRAKDWASRASRSTCSFLISAVEFWPSNMDDRRGIPVCRKGMGL